MTQDARRETSGARRALPPPLPADPFDTTLAGAPATTGAERPAQPMAVAKRPARRTEAPTRPDRPATTTDAERPATTEKTLMDRIAHAATPSDEKTLFFLKDVIYGNQSLGREPTTEEKIAAVRALEQRNHLGELADFIDSTFLNEQVNREVKDAYNRLLRGIINTHIPDEADLIFNIIEFNFKADLETKKHAVDKLISFNDEEINARLHELISSVGEELGDYISSRIVATNGYAQGEADSGVPRIDYDEIAQRVLGSVDPNDVEAIAPDETWDMPRAIPPEEESWADGFGGVLGEDVGPGPVEFEAPRNADGRPDFDGLIATAMSADASELEEAKNAIDLLVQHEREEELAMVAGETATSLAAIDEVKAYATEKLEQYRKGQIATNIELATAKLNDILTDDEITDRVLPLDPAVEIVFRRLIAGDREITQQQMVMANLIDYLDLTMNQKALFGETVIVTTRKALANARKLNESLTGQPAKVRYMIYCAVHADRISHGNNEQCTESCNWARRNVNDAENAERMSRAISARYIHTNHGGAMAEQLHRAQAAMQEISGAHVPVQGAIALTLEITNPDRSTSKVTNNNERIRIGRLTTSDVRLNDSSASRAHATIERNPDGSYTIIDLGSTLGTFVNGERITRKELAKNDVVKVGNTTINVGFVMPEAPHIETPDVTMHDMHAAMGEPPVAARETAARTAQTEKTLVFTIDGRQIAAPNKERMVIGSSEDADIMVDNETVSGLHAVIEKNGRRWVIRNQLATAAAGTLTLNDVDVPPTGVYLRQGDLIGLGEVRIEVGIAEPAAVLDESAEITGLTDEIRRKVVNFGNQWDIVRPTLFEMAGYDDSLTSDEKIGVLRQIRTDLENYGNDLILAVRNLNTLKDSHTSEYRRNDALGGIDLRKLRRIRNSYANSAENTIADLLSKEKSATTVKPMLRTLREGGTAISIAKLQDMSEPRREIAKTIKAIQKREGTMQSRPMPLTTALVQPAALMAETTTAVAVLSSVYVGGGIAYSIAAAAGIGAIGVVAAIKRRGRK